MSHLCRIAKIAHPLLLAGVAALALSACASNRGLSAGADYSSLVAGQSQVGLAELTERYRRNPKDRAVVIHYATVLRAAGQPQQAIAALEQAMLAHPGDMAISIAYAKALTAAGRFEQSLTVIGNVISPDAPDWNALLVQGATLDQMGRHDDARKIYGQAAVIAPGEASIETNLGLSYAMTNDLTRAEQHLRRAVQMRGASAQTRQNLALVVGLQGRFSEARALYAAELPPEQVEANMAYIRALLTQHNRWDLIDKG
ncbi:tetratricopeptide repeat protein [Devosia sp. YIM 151766]|uniref:tetratricopeptide repeat protein n=1 Tax=Devosia sp. YIM 151766 TaxID=3017325 RepID=UPI00255CC07A|nr:tetratricopeptide repeat protein [Devosia sp. YIM 151766]WIY53327.1 tetratricopeptide repeat protein [Devosia sp. YIM 151766]